MANKRGVISDSSFIYLEWKNGFSPEDNEDVKELIEDIDTEYFPNEHSMEDYLPYLTFNQTELLFNEIKDRFGMFEFKKVSLANNDEGEERRRYMPSIEDEPYIEGFVINNNYKEIMTPLMEAMVRDQRWKDFSYDDLRGYFTNPDGILEQYASSLDISKSELPYFPSENEVSGAVQRQDYSLKERQNNKRKEKARKTEQEMNKRNENKLIALAVLGIAMGMVGIGSSAYVNTKIAKTNNVVVEAYQQQKQVAKLQEEEHKADVFGRFFLSNYYTGEKESIEPFLSKGNAKFTQPEQATINSALLENIVLKDDDVIELTYVITFMQDKESSSRRVIFDVERSEEAKHGYLVVSEPVNSPYVSQPSSSKNNE